MTTLVVPRCGALRRAALLSGLAVVVIAGCAAEERARAPVPPDAFPVDPDLVAEVVPLTQGLIREAPVNPPGGERRIVELLRARLDDEPGVVVETREVGPPEALRANLFARVAGRDPTRKPILLLAHADVVPAVAADWTADTPPFAAVVKGGALVGRGALDMLSMAALETLTLVAVARAGGLDAPLFLLVTADEEVDGLGITSAFDAWPVLETAEVALNEGGFIIQDMANPGHDVAAVSVAEKGFLHVELTALGAAGHGSQPDVEHDAPARLVRAVERVLERDDAFRVGDDTAAMFAALGRARGGADAVVLGSPALTKALARATIEKSPNTRALVHDTCALTVLEAGYKRNVIPAKARAVFDCRLLPGTTPDAFRDVLLVAVDDPRVTLTVLAAAKASGSPRRHRILDVVDAVMQRERRLTSTVPILTRGYTDSRVLREHGIDAYGFVPLRIDGDELDAIHGRDERVRTSELEEGLLRLTAIVTGLARAP